MKIPKSIRRAIKSGPIPKIRDWRKIQNNELTRAERVMMFIETYCRVPEGKHVGDPLKIALFQEVFIYAVYDNPAITSTGILSIGRKNGKSGLISAILLAHIIGTEANSNSQIIAAALSREQAGLIYKLASKMIIQSPEIQKMVRLIPSQKTIIGLTKNVEFKAIAKDSSGGSTMGLSPVLVLLDESGQIIGSGNDPFVSALETSQGAHENPLFITISTQSPSDADYLSVMIDDAIRSKDKHTVAHVYESKEGCDLLDQKQWRRSNPALGVFRAEKDLRSQLEKASRLPARESAARNLLLNQRISAESLFLSASVWKKNGDIPDIDVFKNNRVIAGLDLSTRNDLTACVLAAKDNEGYIHVLPFVFCPTKGIEDRSKRDRAPYDLWCREGLMIPLGGEVVDYEQIAEYLKGELDDLEINIESVEFDRWNIDNFKAACARSGVFRDSEFNPVGQGYKDFSPRCNSLLNNMMEGRIKHGGHPLLTMAASNAISISDPSGNIKLDKSKSTLRIDPLVALVMAIYPLTDGQIDEEIDVSGWI
jgi:phage terminase large subunit-like protein